MNKKMTVQIVGTQYQVREATCPNCNAETYITGGQGLYTCSNCGEDFEVTAFNHIDFVPPEGE